MSNTWFKFLLFLEESSHLLEMNSIIRSDSWQSIWDLAASFTNVVGGYAFYKNCCSLICLMIGKRFRRICTISPLYLQFLNDFWAYEIRPKGSESSYKISSWMHFLTFSSSSFSIWMLLPAPMLDPKCFMKLYMNLSICLWPWPPTGWDACKATGIVKSIVKMHLLLIFPKTSFWMSWIKADCSTCWIPYWREKAIKNLRYSVNNIWNPWWIFILGLWSLNASKMYAYKTFC